MSLEYFWETEYKFGEFLKQIFGEQYKRKYSLEGNGIFNLILIKGIDSKTSRESLRKGSKEKGLGGVKNKLTLKINDSTKNNNLYDLTKMNIPSSLGYRKKYRIKHINAFDIDDNYPHKYKRKLSVDI